MYMKRYRLPILAGLILILFGVGTFVLYRQGQAAIVTPAPSHSAVTQQAATPAASSVVSGEPSELIIPSLNIDLQITPGVYNAKTGKWTLTTDKVQYAVMTPQPNTAGGNTFIYGHYRKNVLATLHTIQPGATAVVKTANGKTFTYVLDHVKVVTPDDSAGIFDYQGKPILTIQTCTGVFFQNRQLFTFNLEHVS
jgi:LPXTG-site transpeptidase (sortase) family protein